MPLPVLKLEDIADFLSGAVGDVSYISEANFMGTKTTAFVIGGRWVSKRSAYDVMRDLREAERKATYVAPTVPVLKPSARTAVYSGPFPRKRHSHRCETCGDAVACYKTQCTRPQHTATCSWCKNR